MLKKTLLGIYIGCFYFQHFFGEGYESIKVLKTILVKF
jgi:hypothetical protein